MKEEHVSVPPYSLAVTGTQKYFSGNNPVDFTDIENNDIAQAVLLDLIHLPKKEIFEKVFSDTEIILAQRQRIESEIRAQLKKDGITEMGYFTSESEKDYLQRLAKKVAVCAMAWLDKIEENPKNASLSLER